MAEDGVVEGQGGAPAGVASQVPTTTTAAEEMIPKSQAERDLAALRSSLDSQRAQLARQLAEAQKKSQSLEAQIDEAHKKDMSEFEQAVYRAEKAEKDLLTYQAKEQMSNQVLGMLADAGLPLTVINQVDTTSPETLSRSIVRLVAQQRDEAIARANAAAGKQPVLTPKPPVVDMASPGGAAGSTPEEVLQRAVENQDYGALRKSRDENPYFIA